MSISQMLTDGLIRSPKYQTTLWNRQRGGDLISNHAISDMERYTDSELTKLADSQVRDLRYNIGNVADRVGEQDAVNLAQQRASTNADVAEGVWNRRTEGLGMTKRQRMGAKAQLNLGREVAKAAAAGSTRRGYAQRGRAADQSLAALGDVKLGQQAALMTGLADAWTKEKINEANKKAADRAARNQMIGTGLSIFGMMVMASSEDYKDKVEEKPSLLDKLKKVRVDKWKYKGADAEHIGPYAEEFNNTFGVGTYKDAIDIVSMLGVTLGSVKELNEKVEALGNG